MVADGNLRGDRHLAQNGAGICAGVADPVESSFDGHAEVAVHVGDGTSPCRIPILAAGAIALIGHLEDQHRTEREMLTQAGYEMLRHARAPRGLLVRSDERAFRQTDGLETAGERLGWARAVLHRKLVGPVRTDEARHGVDEVEGHPAGCGRLLTRLVETAANRGESHT